MTEGYFLTHRPEMTAFLPRKFRRTLEIGCGAGGFSFEHLGAAEERWGIEPDVEAAALAAPRFTRLLHGTYDAVAADLPDGYFDLVVANDVIEHMPDHDAFLQAVKRKLAPGATIVGSIPNIRHFTALVKLLVLNDWAYKDDGILDRTHLRFFTEKSLRRTLIENGYRIEQLSGIRSIVREGIAGLTGVKNVVARGAAAALVGLSFGRWSDTQYPQFAFRARYEP